MSSLPLQIPVEGFLAGECWRGFWCIHLKCTSHGSLPARSMFRRHCILDNELFRRHHSFWESQVCLFLVINYSWWNLAMNFLTVNCGVPAQGAAAGMKGVLHFMVLEILLPPSGTLARTCNGKWGHGCVKTCPGWSPETHEDQREPRPLQNSLCLSNQPQSHKICLWVFIVFEFSATKQF